MQFGFAGDFDGGGERGGVEGGAESVVVGLFDGQAIEPFGFCRADDALSRWMMAGPGFGVAPSSPALRWKVSG